MTIPGGCACGCGKPLTGSEFWAEERCAQAWMKRVNGLAPLPSEELVAAAAGFAAAYARAMETPPVEPTGSVAAESTPAGPSLRHFEAAVDEVSAHVNAVLNDLGQPAADFAILPDGDLVAISERARRALSDGDKSAVFRLVAPADPLVECGQPGWLGRLITRLFGKGAA